MKTMLSLRRNRAALHAWTRRLRRDERGVSAVEFAFVAPVMVALFLGTVDTAVGVMMDRKASLLNRTLADLAAQMQRVDNGARDAIFAASQSVLAPHNNRPTGMTIASIVIDGGGTARVCWSESRGMSSPFIAGAVVSNLPAQMRIPRTSLMAAVSNVTYTPDIGYVLTGTYTLGRTPIYMRPRQAVVGGPNNVEQVERVGQPMC